MEQTERVYNVFKQILDQQTTLFFNRHIDQLILCCLYGVAKVSFTLFNEHPVITSLYLGWLIMPSLTGLPIRTLIQGDTQQLQKRSTMQTRSFFKHLYWK
jgi:hypothetical protein